MGLFTAVAKGLALGTVGILHSVGSGIVAAGSLVKPTVSTGAKIVVGLTEVGVEVAKRTAEVIKPK